ncbi:MAG: Para-hydroxybenzoate--polyprenyltransferase, mitochondrial precursor (PHB:polyprenyltransferase) [Alectoria sarmentosa]|nr:MAG: Para-hydroxybenzoate--polyprenyltransferase, mitochondrial precursor (PHB:polyprenyltransferase) [Alectoria sarmentosa]CAD6580720.1 MAG: Para-hydroxybenzoate--polyprenyltransferase, mitochondrial precursor (PHB:polyprenyltransferase) [Alectoria sarmentosa]
MSKNNSPQEPSYSPPTTGILSYLSAGWIPYAELTRIDRPFPILMFYFPFLWGSLIAGIMAEPVVPPLKMAFVNALLLINTTLVRGLGCTWNDILDSDVDVKVARTRLRPVARGAISHRQALIFTAFQLILELGFIQLLPRKFTYYSIAWLVLVAIYPLAKRVTVYTQVALGFTVAWGVLMGFPALDIDLLTSSERMLAAGSLAASNIIWTIGSDLIYAHQDIQDDRKSGINSMAVRHEEKSKAILAGLGMMQILLLTLMGLMVKAGEVYYLGTCGCTLIALWATFGTVNLRDAQDCAKSFKRGAWLTSGAVTTGILAEYMTRSHTF